MTLAATWADELSARLAADGVALRSESASSRCEEALDVAIGDVIAILGDNPTTDTAATARDFSWDRVQLVSTTSTGYSSSPQSAPLVAYRWTFDVDWCQAGTITSVLSDDNDDGTFETTWTAGTDYFTEPVNSRSNGIGYWPVETFVATGTRAWRTSGFRPVLRVTAKWGALSTWEAWPQIKRACFKYAGREIAQEKAPAGVVGFDQWGPVRIKDDPTAVRNLAAYRRVGGLGLPSFA